MAELTPAGFLAGLCGMSLLLLLALSIWSGRESTDDNRRRSRASSDPSSLSGSLQWEARRMLADGQKIHAIKLVRGATGWDLKKAKEAVERSETPRTRAARPRRDRSSAGPGLESEIRVLLAQGKRIEAVKLVRDRTGWGLREAKQFVERIGAVRLDEH